MLKLLKDSFDHLQCKILIGVIFVEVGPQKCVQFFLHHPLGAVRSCVRNLKMGVQRLYSCIRNLITGVHCWWNPQNSGVHYNHFLKMGVQCMHLLYEYHKVCLISSSYCEIIFLNYSTPGPLGEPKKSMISWWLIPNCLTSLRPFTLQ